MKTFGRIRKQTLLEYVTSQVVDLYHYLRMTDEQKREDLAYSLWYKFDDFISDEFIDFDFDFEKFDDGIDKVHQVQTRDPKLFDRFTDWLTKNMDYNIDVIDIPSWHFFSDPSILKHQWLIHFTDDANNIAVNGFKYGVDDITRLAYTTAFKNDGHAKKNGGFNFAYTVDDFYKYVGDRGSSYGKECVVFRASGVRAYHSGDEEWQAIFLGKSARDFIPIKESYDGWYVVNQESGESLVETPELTEVVSWVIDNFDQYRKVSTY